MKKIKKVPVTTERVVEHVTEVKEQIVEEEGGLITLLGKTVLFHCMNYNYIGTLMGVNSNCIYLEDMKVVFETGSYTGKVMKNAESVHNGKGFLMLSTIECFWEI